MEHFGLKEQSEQQVLKRFIDQNQHFELFSEASQKQMQCPSCLYYAIIIIGIYHITWKSFRKGRNYSCISIITTATLTRILEFFIGSFTVVINCNHLVQKSSVMKMYCCNFNQACISTCLNEHITHSAEVASNHQLWLHINIIFRIIFLKPCKNKDKIYL